MSPTATATYHLRPLPSASPSTTTASTLSPIPSNPVLPPPASAFSPVSRPRRPLSPTSLRDVDIPLDHDRPFVPRGKYPVPPTGHELMALFPPAPPILRLGSTSGFFHREERQFFAQAGKEIVRVRLELESLPGGPGGNGGRVASPTHTRHARAHSHGHGRPHSQHREDRDAPPATLPPPPRPRPFPTSAAPPSHMGPPPLPLTVSVSVPTGPPGPAHPGYPAVRAQDPMERLPGEGVPGEDDDDDENAWRRPTPHNARRRAGKHTRRVIVK